MGSKTMYMSLLTWSRNKASVGLRGIHNACHSDGCRTTSYQVGTFARRWVTVRTLSMMEVESA